MTDEQKVPLKLEGRLIGTAMVDEKGHCTAIVDDPEIRKMLSAGSSGFGFKAPPATNEAPPRN